MSVKEIYFLNISNPLFIPLYGIIERKIPSKISVARGFLPLSKNFYNLNNFTNKK